MIPTPNQNLLMRRTVRKKRGTTADITANAVAAGNIVRAARLWPRAVDCLRCVRRESRRRQSSNAMTSTNKNGAGSVIQSRDHQKERL